MATRPKKRASGASCTPQKISKRVVSTKRHTVGYMIGDKQVSVAQARQLAQRGSLSGVQVIGQHIQSVPGKTRLTDLPIVIK